MKDARLSGKVAVVTGGGSGIGAAISQRFCEQGASVHILDLNIERTQALADNITMAGGQCTAHTCNITDGAAVQHVIDQVILQQRVDILVNNAGIGFIGNIEQTTGEDMDRLYQVNVKGIYHCVRALIPHMKAQGGGVILNLASIAASIGIPDRFAYSMTKGAVLTMTYSIAIDYIDHRIRCNCISPARVHTPFVDDYLAKNFPESIEEEFARLSATQPIGRMAKPQEIADLAVYLCSDEASFVTGTDYPIDGGFIKLPHKI